LATELCGTSIASRGAAQQRVTEALRHNPHIRYGRSDRRGYVLCRLDAQAMQAQLMAVDDPANPDSTLQTMARFVVQARQPGAQPA
jgi:alkaline phosphatase D